MRNRWNIRELEAVTLSASNGSCKERPEYVNVKQAVEEGGVTKQDMNCQGEWNLRTGWRLVVCAGLCGALVWGIVPVAAQNKGVNVSIQGKDGSEAGLVVSAQATAKEVGLPLYPGSRPHQEQGEESSAAKLGLWGSSFGFKLVVLKMESNDSPEKVAAFYKKELARYGKVLNCSEPSKSEKDKGDSSKVLTCGDDKPDAGRLLFKAGTKERQHLVSVKTNGAGSIFQLVYLEARGEEKGSV